LQPPPVESGRNKVRLVLHGAPQHLIGGNREVQSGSLTPSTSYVFFNLLERLFVDGDVTPRGAQELVEVAAHDLDRIHAAATASWMAGYARATMRVTAQSVNSPEEPGLPTFVVASPLYVEYVSNPSRDG
jgi:hypothetical protein